MGELLTPMRLLAHRLSAGAKLSRAELVALETLAGPPRRLARGEELLAENEKANQIWLLASGLALRQKWLRDGRRQIIALMIPGELSEKGPISPFGAGHAIVAAEPAEFVPIDRQKLQRLTEAHPNVAVALLADEARRNSLYGEWIVSLGRRSVEERVAYFLYETLVRFRALGLVVDDRMRLPLTQADVADIVGLSAVHLNRTIQRLRGRNLVEWLGEEIRVLDTSALASLAQYNPELERLSFRLRDDLGQFKGNGQLSDDDAARVAD